MKILNRSATITKNTEDQFYLTAKILALSSTIVYLLFYWQGNKGFRLGDEGFLWYGVQRVMLGEVPIRDFMSYDPGRYYWSAALMSIFGDNGIMSLRISVAIFQVMGLFIGVILIAQSARSLGKDKYFFWIISSAIVAVWMFPRHKLFDISLSIFLVGILSFLVRGPSIWRYFITGVCVGLVAVFGRNHGIYGVVGSFGVMLWLSIKATERPVIVRCLLPWVTGVTVGYLPVILLVLFEPGFAAAFWESIRFLFERKTTNLRLPVPWPWKINYTSLPIGLAFRGFLTGLFFLLLPIFSTVWIILLMYRKIAGKAVQPALVAAGSLMVPYMHYAYSRADIRHLCQGIFPFLIACILLLSEQPLKVRWMLLTALFMASIWVMYPKHPGWQCSSSKQCMEVEISGNKLLVRAKAAEDVRLLRNLADQYAPNGRTFITVPFWPGAYALMERKSPLWEIYPIWPRKESFEEKEIERIEAAQPGFVLINDTPLDGLNELRFSKTHPLTYHYIINHFDLLPDKSHPAYAIYRAKRTDQ